MKISSTAPLVCICIPTYNAERTIRETLVSILNQNYQNISIHVVDNASTDNTLKVVSGIADSRINIHENQMNIGGEGNFNRCIQFFDGKYAAIFHADDVYESEMLAKQVEFMEANPEAGAVFTAAKIINDSGSVIGHIRLPKEFNSPSHLYDFRKIFKAILRHSNFLICPSAMVRTEVYQQEIKSWRGLMFGSSADLDVWLRIARRHLVGVLPMPLMRYRISDSQGSARVRVQTDRADFFRVTDHYLDEDDVKFLIDRRDLQNYARLERRDRVMRAVNFFLIGQSRQARELLRDIYSKDSLKAAFGGKRGAGVLVAGIYLHILLLLRLGKIGQFTVGVMKRTMRK